MAPDKDVFHRNAKLFRKQSGYTVDKLARELDVSTSTVQSWERTDESARGINGDKLVRLAALYGRHPREFYTEEEVDIPQAVGVILKIAPDLSLPLRRKLQQIADEINKEYSRQPSVMRRHRGRTS